MRNNYIQSQKNCGLKIGDRVLIYRSAKKGEGGWQNSWEEWMDLTIGHEGKISNISGDGICINIKEVPWEDFGFNSVPDYYYPFFVLKK